MLRVRDLGILRLWESGVNHLDIAEEMGMEGWYVERIIRRMHRIEYTEDRPPQNPPNDLWRRLLEPRNRRIYERRRKGATYTQIALEFNLSLTRVRQLCRREARRTHDA